MVAASSVAPAEVDGSLRHLFGRLAVVEARVATALARRRRVDPDPDDRFRGLYLSRSHVDRLLFDAAALAVDSHDVGTDALLADVEAEADRLAGASVRLRELAATFGLSAPEVDALLVALAPDLDQRFEKLYAYLHDDVSRQRASVGLAIQLGGARNTDAEARSWFTASAPLLRHGLLVVDDVERPFLARPLRVPDRVTAHLLGDDHVDAALANFVVHPPALATADGHALARAIRAGVQVVHCRQPAGLWAAAVAVAALGHGGCLVVELPEDSSDAADTIGRATREALLLRRVLVLGPVERAPDSAVLAATGSGGQVVLYGSGPWNPAWAASGALALDLSALARHPASDLWRAALGEDVELASALSAFRLAPEQIERAVSAARSHAAADGRPLDGELLAAGARMQSSTGLGRLARRVEPQATWADLVVPATSLAGLRHLADRVRWRDRVLGEWRLRRAGGRGEGIAALFAGEPGTGKTLAAEVIAADLGLDLYVIDLSAVVDKYIGETEKNLERIFTGAEGVNGVLFFDEADALFGKRSDVSDAHDRYANIETSYLLQRMETFDGVAILATNLMANLDEAFARRLSVVVDFVRPDVAERRLLWQNALAAVPLADDIDLEHCAAAFDLTGGEIRNIAVTAAYLAAAAGTWVGTESITQGVQSEYRKTGRLYAPFARIADS